MPNAADGKILRFSAAVGLSGSAVCGSCGSPQQIAAVCRACAFQLIDVALTDSSVVLLEHRDVFAEDRESSAGTLRLRYDHYEICQTPDGVPWELGRGAMGITFKATDTHLGCPVALKLINKRYLQSVAARERLLKEARTAAQLRHANIASVFHLGLGGDTCFFAMEYIGGETLDAHVRRIGRLEWRSALEIVSQCTRALRVAHSQQFIHRDIKPTNIMLTLAEHRAGSDLTVKLIDFGLVKAVALEPVPDEAGDAYFAGTPYYASPEQLKRGNVDARSDIYSLGMSLQFMLTGVVLDSQSVREDDQETKRKPAGEFSLVGLPAEVPKPVAELLRSMVAVAPAHRPQSADEVLDRIADCQAISETVSTRPHLLKENVPAPRKKTAENRGQRKFWSVLAFGIFLTVCAAIRSHFVKDAREEAVSRSPVVSMESRALFDQAGESFRKYTKADTEKAIDLYLKAVKISPEFSEAHALLASAYLENVGRYNAPAEQLDFGIASAQRALAVDPKSSKAYQALGAIRSYQGQNWEALSQLHHALEIDPRFLPAMCDFSLLWICVGEPQFALPWAVAATKTEPAKIQGWHAAAEASIELCSDDRAEEYYTRCTELRPTWLPGYCGLIHLHLLQGDFVRARHDFAKAQSIQPDLIFTLTLGAQIEFFSGNFKEAEVLYRRLLVLDRGGMARYYSGISYLSALGFLRCRAGDKREGVSLLEEAAKVPSANSEGSAEVYNLAAIRAIQDRRDESLALLNQAINAGWNDYRATRLDPRFTSLRESLQFERILDELKNRVTVKRREAERLCDQPLNLADFPVRNSHHGAAW